MVPLATVLRGSFSNRLLSPYYGKPSFQFFQHNIRVNLARTLNSSTLVSAALHNFPIDASNESNRASDIIPSNDYEDPLRPNYQTFQWLLDSCFSSVSASLTDAQRLHGLVLKSGFIQEYDLCSSLVALYLSGGRLLDADQLFDDMLLTGLTLPVSIWNKIIACYAAKKLTFKVFCMLSRMVCEDCRPDEFTLANVLKVCGGIDAKRTNLLYIEQIHAKIIRYGFDNNHLVCNPLIDLYAKNGLINSAEIVFEKLCFRDNITWVAMISGLSQNGFEKQSILLFCDEMHSKGIFPTPYVVSSILSSCSKIKSFQLGKELHALTFKWGLSNEVFVSNALVSLYCRLGDFTSAENLFRRMNFKDGVSYNSLISGLAQHGFSEKSFNMFKEMQRDFFKPDCVTVASLLSACANNGDFNKGLQLHTYALKSGICLDMIIEGSLLDLYVKCSDVQTANKYFLTTKMKNVVLWNVMLVAYGQIGDINSSFQIFSEMQMKGLEPNQYTYPSILRTCTQVGAHELGSQIHTQAIKTGFQFNLYVCSVLIDMYAKHGNINAAEKIFTRLQEDDVVSWTAMISGCAQFGMHYEALEHFKEMRNRGIQPDSIGFASAISACSGIQLLQKGKQIHAQIYIFGFAEDLSIGNSLVSLYSRCGRVDEAYNAFRRIIDKDNISWNGLISGFAQSGHYREALKVFAEMNQIGIEANSFTFGSAISAAANTANVKEGKQLHAKMIKNGYNLETESSNALITLYSKCGNINDAKQEFLDVIKRNEITYNAMITGLSQHGYGEEALELFNEMKKNDLMPNYVTFIGILSACSHVGLVEEGLRYFKSMSEEYKLVPKIEHYVCVVDILGRAGFIDRAKKFIEDMPINPDAMIWRTVLSSCILHKNIEFGEVAARRLLELEPEDSATYTLISNMYEVNLNWSRRDEVRRIMRDRGVRKEPGQSWIEVKNTVNAFFCGDYLHPLSEKIYEYLEELNKSAERIGYVKGRGIHVHSEKLAISYGLISLDSKIPICVMKNLRVCKDCHDWIKCVSRVSNRVIVVRDGFRFHHFEEGVCSCRDYW